MEIVLDCPYFESRVPTSNDPEEISHGFDMKREEEPDFLGLRNAVSPAGARSSSKKEEDFSGRAPDSYSQDIPSPSSGKFFNLEMNTMVDMVINN